MRAGPFFLPKEVDESVAAVYGLHGLPLPHLPPATGEPANVTPAVISHTYGISGVAPSGTVKNRQAVAEFARLEKTSPADLKSFFALYLPNATDRQSSVYRYVGSWYFCGDLKRWSNEILADDTPLAHSVSYGIQGPVWHHLGCFPWQMAEIDANFAKLAANKQTIIFSSGDYSSGYTKLVSRCSSLALASEQPLGHRRGCHAFRGPATWSGGDCCRPVW